MSTPIATRNAAIVETGAAPIVLSEADAERIRAATDAAQAPATRRAYDSLWRNFAAWCQERAYQPLPAAPVAVAAYLAERAQAVKPATVRLDAAAIGHQHRQRNLPNPVDSEGVKSALAGLARLGRAGAQKQARGISREDLAAIRATACTPRAGRGGKMETEARARARGQVDIALCAVMFDGMLRRSEAAVLTWDDIAPAADGSGRLTVRHSKTDPQGEGKVLWISPATMAALDALRGESADGAAPVFGLSGQQISRRIAAACEAAGLGKGYSGHSLRVGAAQALAAANISLAGIMENGRWQSARMPARYTRNAAAAQSAMARLYRQNGGG